MNDELLTKEACQAILGVGESAMTKYLREIRHFRLGNRCGWCWMPEGVTQHAPGHDHEPESNGRHRFRKTPPLDLVDISEIAKRAGTTPGTVQTWRHRHADFPAPLVHLRIGPVWEWPPVIEWLRKERKPGRPRKATSPVSDYRGSEE